MADSLAERARKTIGTDLGLALVGRIIRGADKRRVQDRRPATLSTPTGIEQQESPLGGEPQMVRERFSILALDLLRKFLLKVILKHRIYLEIIKGETRKRMSRRIIQCPKCKGEIEVFSNPIPTVDIIIEYGEEGIVLIKRKNPPYGWAIPGGFVDYGESLEKAAVSEAKEETNLRG